MDTEQDILQRRLVQFIVHDVFNTITEQDILKQLSDGRWTLKGGVLTDGQLKVLKKEAEMLQKTNMYAILCSELLYHARQALDNAQTENDIISAKLLSYFVDVVTSKVKKIANL